MPSSLPLTQGTRWCCHGLLQIHHTHCISLTQVWWALCCWHQGRPKIVLPTQCWRPCSLPNSDCNSAVFPIWLLTLLGCLCPFPSTLPSQICLQLTELVWKLARWRSAHSWRSTAWFPFLRFSSSPTYSTTGCPISNQISKAHSSLHFKSWSGQTCSECLHRSSRSTVHRSHQHSPPHYCQLGWTSRSLVHMCGQWMTKSRREQFGLLRSPTLWACCPHLQLSCTQCCLRSCAIQCSLYEQRRVLWGRCLHT